MSDTIDTWKDFRESYTYAEFDPLGVVEWGDRAVAEIVWLREALRIADEMRRADEAETCRLRDQVEAEQQYAAYVITDLQQQIERLRGETTKYMARTQVLRDYIVQYSPTLWQDFCRTRPEAIKWFDKDGVAVAYCVSCGKQKEQCDGC